MAPGSLAVGIRNSVNVRLGPGPGVNWPVPLEAPEAEDPETEPPEVAPLLWTLPDWGAATPLPVLALELPVGAVPPLLAPAEMLPLDAAGCEPLAPAPPEGAPSAPLAPDVPSLVVCEGAAVEPLPHAERKAAAAALQGTSRALMLGSPWEGPGSSITLLAVWPPTLTEFVIAELFGSHAGSAWIRVPS